MPKSPVIEPFLGPWWPNTQDQAPANGPASSLCLTGLDPKNHTYFLNRCCLQHDWCYAFISCPQTLIYFVPYTWQCMNPGAAHCGVASMPGVSQKCATQLCECDREFARCVSNYPCPRKKPGCKESNYIMLQTMSNNDI
ncbi:uncharacterized protein LOC118184606 [Stegodyphus dumicola]|uniref:uncharacterized protein LOC118184606 n=1 Tax=Stegodyphus dumicola TaxID=202533 RepID=UPI0015AB1E05|nr:uncharacterized protein LOC118184606 [Stegodyphus dumicola]